MKPVTLTAASSRLAFCALVAMTVSVIPAGVQAQSTGNLEIQKRRLNIFAEPTLNQGDTVRWGIRFVNNGPQPAFGMDATVVDDFDDTLLENVSWVCTPSVAPRNCPNPPTNAGSGDINHDVNLNFAESCDCVVTATIRDCVLGELTNTATITAIPPDSDPDTSDNTATVSEPIIALANIAVVKDDGRETLECDDDVTYQITVTNNGPHCHPAVRIIDERPDDLDNLEWLCEGTACPAPEGAGFIDEVFQLEDGEEVIFIVSAEVDADGTRDTLTNTAAYIDTLGIDPNPENDVSSDTDVLACAEVPTLPELAIVGLALALLALGARRLRRPSLS